MDKIYFYSWKKPYFEFSNFFYAPIIIDGKEYTTNEHYFQSAKFLNKYYAERIRLAKTPVIAKKMGASRDFPIHPDWDTRRIDVMRRAVYAKFTQHKELKKLLLSTGDAILIEDSPTDYFWGCGKDKSGKNMLGQILMETREKLKNE